MFSWAFFMQEIFDNCTFYNPSQFSRCKEESLQKCNGKNVKVTGKYVCIAQHLFIYFSVYRKLLTRDFFFLFVCFCI